MTWVVLTVAAAFRQNLRSILQKRLTGPLSINGAAYVRFCFALPFAWLYLAVLLAISGVPAIVGPELAAVGGFALGGAVAQILGTACLVAAFTRASFAVSAWRWVCWPAPASPWRRSASAAPPSRWRTVTRRCVRG